MNKEKKLLIGLIVKESKYSLGSKKEKILILLETVFI